MRGTDGTFQAHEVPEQNTFDEETEVAVVAVS